MSILQPPILVKTEPLTVIKNEPPDPEIKKIDIDDALHSSDKEIILDAKDIDIVSHPILSEDFIKSETVSENIFESKHSEYVETQVFVKTEDAPLVKIENIIECEKLNKIEDIDDDGKGSWGTGQEVIEIQGIATSRRKATHPDKPGLAQCYKTVEATLWEKEKGKIKVIKAPDVIRVEPHEYTSLAKDKHVCSHCQQAFKNLKYVKYHIKRMHKKVTTMYKCPYCPHESKWSLRTHIIHKHKDVKDIRWFRCHLCETKFKLKGDLNRHMQVHLAHEDRLGKCLVCRKKSTQKISEKRYCCEKCTKKRQLKYHCDKCSYKTYALAFLNKHKITHLEPEEIQYFHCYHCSFKSKYKASLTTHIFGHFNKENVPFYCYMCDFVTLKRDVIIEHLTKSHSKYQRKLGDTSTKKYHLRYSCDKCDYKTYIHTNWKRHNISHLKPEEIEYFYCYHCSYKSKHKSYINYHISKHFKNEDVPFHCYICDFMTPKRDLIVEHLIKHSK